MMITKICPSMRSKVMETSDLIITLCRKLDFQLAYGSPAIFGNAKFVRILTLQLKLVTIEEVKLN